MNKRKLYIISVPFFLASSLPLYSTHPLQSVFLMRKFGGLVQNSSLSPTGKLKSNNLIWELKESASYS
ncbi:MAG: hypothetical protein CM1200mP30_13910 [Pseudomonadota bacterium]|nr:MAG: hypothetical protein CM1200mP30_13910 [Pseudomonadota bacterium]